MLLVKKWLKRNKFKTVLILVLLKVLIACEYFSLNNEYKSILNYFNHKMVNHFPKGYEFVGRCTHHLDTFTSGNNTISYFLEIKNADGEIKVAKNKYKNYFKYKCTDSCIVVVDEFMLDNFGYEEVDTIQIKKSIKNNKCKLNIIVPNLMDTDYTISRNSPKLIDGFYFIPIETKLGYYNKKIIKEISTLDDSIKHGFTKGIAYNEEKKAIIYYILFW